MKPAQIRVFDGLRLTSEHLDHLQQSLITTAQDLREVGELLAFLRQPEPPGGWREALDMLPLVKSVMSMRPKTIAKAPCQEIVIEGDELDRPGKGLDSLPIPISTPGWDIAPFTTLSQYITKDPDNGIQNMGIYRGQVKAPRRLGMNPSLELRPGIYVHWEKMKRAGKKLAAAVVLGAPPCIAFASAQKAPETLDELDGPVELALNDIGTVTLRTSSIVIADSYADNRDSGAFILIDETTNDTIGASANGAPSSGAAAQGPG